MASIDSYQQFASFADLLGAEVSAHPKRTAIQFLGDGESLTETLTYADLDGRVREVACWLSSRVPPRSRVLLSFNPGLDFVYAFLGCVYAGVTAVPVYPPRRRGKLDRLEAIAIDSQASLVLSTIELQEENSTSDAYPYFKSCPFHPIEAIQGGSEGWSKSEIRRTDLAFLQYTSGSTGVPKGVSVSHQNLLHNMKVIHALFGQSRDEVVMAGWLPMYHDMGLVGNLLHPLSLGGKLVYMPPMAFLQKPIRWLKMISDYKATISGGPNFAYNLCISRTTPEEREGIDLSSWQIAFNGAEPIRYETLRDFDLTFSRYGFSKSALSPCYGMAETTLMVTGSGPDTPWQSIEVDAAALRNNQVIVIDSPLSKLPQPTVQRLASSGVPHSDIDLQIVDPYTLRRCRPNEVGEIWIRSGSVAQGYWGREELTESTFHAKINDSINDEVKPVESSLHFESKELRYLRTGDLGFLHNGELYVAGRTKDLIILNGENHYPQDLEASIETSHQHLKPGSCVAFALQTQPGEINTHGSVDEQGYLERVYVAQEIHREAMRSFDLAEIVAAAYRACWEEHQVALDGFLLVRPGGIPKTSSGKLQRQKTRMMFEDGTLPLVASWQRDRDGAPVTIKSPSANRVDFVDSNFDQVPEKVEEQQSLERWLQAQVAAHAGLLADAIECDKPIAIYGLKSLSIVRLAGQLSEKLGKTVSPTLVFDYPTIRLISRFLVFGNASLPVTEHQTTDTTDLRMDDPIAIVGISCRFPGASDPIEFRRILNAGICTIRNRPVSRGSDSTSDHTYNSGSPKNQPGGYLESIDQFEPLFFGISPREAEEMDPQQRLMLEVCYEAFEQAGIPVLSRGRLNTGVFIGVSGNEYARAMALAGASVSGHTATGNSMAMVANRISYLFNFCGPSFTVDTACSSSLLAVHLAAESIRRGECELAVAGGVSLQASPDVSESLGAAGMLSPSGTSCAFSSGADGFVRGEGCGAVLLKRLSAAQRDGDRIFCLLRGSAVNQDGRSNGLTAPNGLAQQEVILAALKRSGLTPQDIDYIEAHGTSTELGDPIEMGALTSVFVTPDKPRQKPLWVGSVKTNIGHLEGAAGIAGLIKTALALHQEKLPPHLHFESPSQHIDWQPDIKIPTELTSWSQHPDRVRRAGISSFGFGGTNAHVILEEAPPVDSLVKSSETSSGSQGASEHVPHRTYWLKVSAKSTEALCELARRYAKSFSIHDDAGKLVDTELAGASLQDISYAGNVGRSDFNCRSAIGFSTREELVARLLELAGTPNPSGLVLSETFSQATDPARIQDEESSKWSLAMERYVQGEEISWNSLYTIDRLESRELDSVGHSQPAQACYRRTVSLPTYPFQRQRCWFRTESPKSPVSELSKPTKLQLRSTESNSLEVSSVSSLLGTRLDVAGSSIIYEVDLRTLAGLADHRLRGESVFPAAGFLELALLAGESTYLGRITVEEMQLEQALRWSPGTPTRVQVVVEGEECRILSRQSEGWREHARCRLSESDVMTGDAYPQDIASAVPIEIEDHYTRCSSVGLDYSGDFRSLRMLSTHGRQCFGEVGLPVIEGEWTGHSYRLHPALLDGCFQSVASLLTDEGGLWLPISIGSYGVLPVLDSTSDSDGRFRFVATMKDSETTDHRTVDISIYTHATNTLFASLRGLTLKRITSAAESTSSDSCLVSYEGWVPRLRCTETAPPPALLATDLGNAVRKTRNALLETSGYEIDLPSREILTELSVAWTVNAFVELFGMLEVGRTLEEASLLSKAAVDPSKRPLFFRLIEILVDGGFLKRELGGWSVLKPFVQTDVAALSCVQLSLHVRMAPEIQLLGRCGSILSDVLRGDIDPLPILFSDKSSGSAVDVYSRAAGAQVLNGLLAEAACNLACNLSPGRTLRILEIGAGTGATTRLLLARLPADRIAYTFTDIARGFLANAKEEFDRHDSGVALDEQACKEGLKSFSCQSLNIEIDPIEQGFSSESFDLIVAANVLHATAKLDDTLNHVERLLAPGGQLMLLEGTHPVAWMDLTFGLTDGWWRFVGRDPSRSYALISPDEWISKLSRTGFTCVDIIGPDSLHLRKSNGSTLSNAGLEFLDSQNIPENVLMVATKGTKQIGETHGKRVSSRDMLVISDDSSTALTLSNALRDRGTHCDAMTLTSFDTAEVSSQLLQYCNQHANGHPSELHIVFSVDENRYLMETSSVTTESCSLTTQLVGVIQAVLANRAPDSEIASTPRITLVTRRRSSGDFLINSGSISYLGLHGGSLRGLMRTVALEQPQWLCKSIEFESHSENIWNEALDELLIADGDLDDEPEILISKGVRYGRRLMKYSALTEDLHRSVLRIGQRGHFESLEWKDCKRDRVGPQNVEIEIRAVGLNFRDVLNALGKYPDEVPLGSECAGIVKRIGTSVSEFKVGDRVVAIAADSFATSVVASSKAVWPIPSSFSFETAASLPVAYLTAAVALESLARLKPEEGVLIHAATGGVGLAALNLSLAMGSKVFVTASPSKHSYLYGLGLEQVFDSRATGFSTGVKNSNSGRGVEVILNLLDESFLEENLEALSFGGRYIDVTKPSQQLEEKLRRLRPDVIYHRFDLAKLLLDEPVEMHRMCDKLMNRIEKGELETLPLECYEMKQAAHAFRKMQRATHIGKIVLRQSEPTLAIRHTRLASIRPDGAYVVVGGLGDIGLLTVRILSEKHAGFIAIISRNGPTSAQQIELDRLMKLGQRILLIRADASNALELDVALQSVREQMPILGVIHSAGVLDDAMLSEQTTAGIQKVWQSKAAIAWNLHRLTSNDALELFVLYSSLASLLGAPGQANHAAANAFMDGLFEYRLQHGLPATILNWGPWSEIGEAARKSTASRMDLRGVGVVAPSVGSNAIECLLTTANARLAVAPLSVELMQPRLKKLRLFDLLRNPSRITNTVEASLALQLIQIPQAAQQSWMIEKVTQTLAKILGIENKLDVSAETSFVDLGLDSLTGIEFIDSLNRQWSTKLPTSAVYDYPNISKITKKMLLQLNQPHPEMPSALAAPPENESSMNVQSNQSAQGDHEFDDGLAKLLTELDQWK